MAELGQREILLRMTKWMKKEVVEPIHIKMKMGTSCIEARYEGEASTYCLAKPKHLKCKGIFDTTSNANKMLL